MAKREFQVTIPIAGHAFMTVEADSAEEAIELAMMGEITTQDIETWEPLEQFNQGNVCYCPHPWQAEAEDMGAAEEDSAA